MSQPTNNSSRASQKAADAGRPFILAEFMPFQVTVLSARLSRLIARAYFTQFAITIPEWRVLAMISQHEQVTAQRVADETPLDKVAVSRAVAALVARGYVLKQASPTDRRAILLRLSAAGIEVTRQIQKISLEIEAQALSALSVEEQTQFGQMLARLTARVRDISA